MKKSYSGQTPTPSKVVIVPKPSKSNEQETATQSNPLQDLTEMDLLKEVKEQKEK